MVINSYIVPWFSCMPNLEQYIYPNRFDFWWFVSWNAGTKCPNRDECWKGLGSITQGVIRITYRCTNCNYSSLNSMTASLYEWQLLWFGNKTINSKLKVNIYLLQMNFKQDSTHNLLMHCLIKCHWRSTMYCDTSYNVGNLAWGHKVWLEA